MELTETCQDEMHNLKLTYVAGKVIDVVLPSLTPACPDSRVLTFETVFKLVFTIARVVP